MRTTLGTLIVVVAAALAAQADVQVFFTAASQGSPWEGAGPANVFAPTAGNGTDYRLDGYRPNYANFPSGFFGCPIMPANDFAYIWVKFNTDTQQGPVDNAKLDGLHLVLKNYDGTLATPLDIAYYLAVNDDPPNVRWDGPYTPPNFPDFKRNPQSLVAIAANGIVNRAVDVPVNLYSGNLRVALLGAVKLAPGLYHYELGSLGLHFNTGPASPPVELGSVEVTPEPAAGFLLLLALGLRRR